MIDSSSAMTTRTGKARSFATWLARFRDEPVEQLVLGPFQLLDRCQHIGTVSRHCIGVLLGLVVLAVGERRLRHESPQARLVGLPSQERELLLDDREVGPGALQPVRHVRQTPFDEPPRHRTYECKRPRTPAIE